MAETNGQVANGDAAASLTDPGQFRSNKWLMLKGFLMRLMFAYFIYSLFRRNPTPSGPHAGGGLPGTILGPATNMFAKGDVMELYAYVTESEEFSNSTYKASPFWHKPDVHYGDWESGEGKDGTYTFADTIKASESLMNNGSLYLHIFLVKEGFSPNPADEDNYSAKYTLHRYRTLTRCKRRKISRTMNLLTGETDAPSDLIATESTPSEAKFLPCSTHWHPNLTMLLVDDNTPWTQGAVPSPIKEYMEFYSPTNEYYPVLYFNDYWNLNEQYFPVNSTTPELELRLTLSPTSLLRWQLYLSQSMRQKGWYANLLGDSENGAGAPADEEEDTMKRTLLETNPYLLGLTVIVSIVHGIFELLAFKNDIQFWRSRESFAGLSVRSVFFNVFYTLIVVLYVLDNETNFMVRLSMVMALGIEVWKIKKVATFTFDYERKMLGIFPRISFKFTSSYVESETQQYDRLAFRYLSWLLFPLLAAYAIYSLIYEEHRGWYSWVLSMLYGYLLTFGFIAMTPQLFINYKLKSVAHLPWRMLTYKALNTFIDDMFAFVIKTPTLYRIGCLRDDIIFFIYLYQRWVYRMDPGRINEFGVSQVMLDKLAAGEPIDDCSEPPMPIEATKEEETSSPFSDDDAEIRRRGEVSDADGSPDSAAQPGTVECKKSS